MSHSAENPSNPYAASASAFRDLPPSQLGGEVSQRTVELLNDTRPWVLFLGILGCLGSILMAVGSVAMLIFSLMRQDGTMTFIGFVYLIFATVYVIPAMLLIRFSRRIAALAGQPTVQNLEVALEAQKKFWRFVGIVVAVVLVVYVVILVAALIFGLLGVRGMNP